MPGPQSAVGRNPTALFHLRARISPDGASACAIVVPRACMRIASALRRVLRFSRSRHSFADSAPSRTCCPGLPGWRARIASVTLSFRRPSGRENGRQFSYKQNAEEGVRLDEQRGTMVRGRKGGWRRPFVAGCGNGQRGLPGPFCGLYARCDAIAGRCVRIRIRILMNRRFSTFHRAHTWPYPAGAACVPAIVAHASIVRTIPYFFATFILTTLLLRIVTGERPCQAAGGGCAGFHGKTSVGAARRDS